MEVLVKTLPHIPNVLQLVQKRFKLEQLEVLAFVGEGDDGNAVLDLGEEAGARVVHQDHFGRIPVSDDPEVLYYAVVRPETAFSVESVRYELSFKN